LKREPKWFSIYSLHLLFLAIELFDKKQMKVVIQRVNRASVEVNGKIISSIKKGLMILVGIENADTDEDIKWLCNKIVGLRIFNDTEGVMNTSVQDIDGEILAISQFTLHAKTKKGNRPSYIYAAKPDISIPMYQEFVMYLSNKLGKVVQTGEFGAYMKVDLENDGPVTIVIDSKNRE
jgi:D-tyrosyl-tRNA(Tyr) deacylase